MISLVAHISYYCVQETYQIVVNGQRNVFVAAMEILSMKSEKGEIIQDVGKWSDV